MREGDWGIYSEKDRFSGYFSKSSDFISLPEVGKTLVSFLG